MSNNSENLNMSEPDSFPLIVRNREELESLIIDRHRKGDTIRGLSRRYKMGRNTIRGILNKHVNQRDKGHDVLKDKKVQLNRYSKLDAFIPKIKELFEKFPTITGQRVFEELKDSGYDGSISLLRERLQKLRPRPSKKPVVRFETSPGRQGQMDWSEYTINFKVSGKTKVLCFSYVLGYSRRHYIDFTSNRNFFTLIRRHQDAFNHFGGIPEECLYDGEKTILLRWEGGQPVFNPSFIAFITHCHCKPIMCRPRTPETKGKIEAPFKYVENNLLNGRDFQDMNDLKAMAKWWMREKSDTHIHDTTKKPPLELFIDNEQAALQPLPIHPYDSSEVFYRIGRFDGFIEFETNKYSIPYEYGGVILALKASENEISIYSPQLVRIAYHERLPFGACKIIEKPEHRTSKKVRYGLESVKETFLALGDVAESFLTGLKEIHPRNCGFHGRYILSFKERYHCGDIVKALEHAIKYHAYDCKAVERILMAKAKVRTLESIRNEKAGSLLQKALPQIKQRPLKEYEELFKNKEKIDEQESKTGRGEETPNQTAPEDSETKEDGESS